jgi:hypothetical protein
MEVIVPADPVKTTRSWLLEHLAGVQVVKNRPATITGHVVTVRRSGGLRPNLVSDAAWLTVECFAPDDDQLGALTHEVWALLFAMAGEVIDGVQCYRVTELGGPADMPLTDAGEFQRPRYVMSVQAQFRAGTPTGSPVSS